MIEGFHILQIVAMGALLLSLTSAVIIKDLMYSVLMLAAGSLSLGGVFFLNASPYAGAVEISVGAGLITALLATAISLTSGNGDESGSQTGCRLPAGFRDWPPCIRGRLRIVRSGI